MNASSDPRLSIKVSKFFCSALERVVSVRSKICCTSEVSICQTSGVVGFLNGTFLVALTASLVMVGSVVGAASGTTSSLTWGFFFNSFFLPLDLALSSSSLAVYFSALVSGIVVAGATPVLQPTAAAIAVFCLSSNIGKYLVFILSNVSGCAVATSQSVNFFWISFRNSGGAFEMATIS